MHLHGNKDLAIIQRNDEAHCVIIVSIRAVADKHWQDVRQMYEPDAYDRVQNSSEKKGKPKSPYDFDGSGMLTIENLEHYLEVKGYQVRYNIVKHEMEYIGFPDYFEGAESNLAPILIKNELQKHLKKNVASRMLWIILKI